MEALTIKEGIKIKGEGAYQELIDYLSQRHNLEDQTRLFLQQLREYRNHISYEGFMIHKNYISLNKDKIILIIKKLLNEFK